MDACPIPQAADPCAIVIFGASGDLTKRKLLPSLYNLGSYHLLPAHFSVIGVARRPLSLCDDRQAIVGVGFIARREGPVAAGHYREAVWP